MRLRKMQEDGVRLRVGSRGLGGCGVRVDVARALRLCRTYRLGKGVRLDELYFQRLF